MGATLAQFAVTILKKGVDYIKDDRTSFHGLNAPRWVSLSGPGIGVGNFEADGFRIISERGGNALTLATEPFDLASKKWLGPLWFPDNMNDGSLEASLWPSLLLFHREAIVKKLGVKEKAFDRWAHSIYAATWKGYAKALYPSAKLTGSKQYLAFNAAQWEGWARRLIGKIGATLAVAALCLSLSACSGCSSPDPYEMTGFGDGLTEEPQPAPAQP